MGCGLRGTPGYICKFKFLLLPMELSFYPLGLFNLNTGDGILFAAAFLIFVPLPYLVLLLVFNFIIKKYLLLKKKTQTG
jgi:hypothetical protein